MKKKKKNGINATYLKWQASREPKEQASHKPFFDSADFVLLSFVMCYSLFMHEAIYRH